MQFLAQWLCQPLGDGGIQKIHGTKFKQKREKQARNKISSYHAESLNACTRALHVAVVDHDITENLSRVDELEKRNIL